MITYTFKMDDGAEFHFDVDLDRKKCQPCEESQASWTSLSFNKCSICPLDVRTNPRCPAAVDLEQIASKFKQILSYTRTVVEVRTEQRTYVKQCDAQTGLQALQGVVMASSDCPVLRQLRGLARYHLPFASIDETLFRTVSAYLLKQYFILKSGGIPDMELMQLRKFYEDLQELNIAFKKRLEAASEQDANLNAVVALMSIAIAVSYSLDDQLTEMGNRVMDELWNK